LLLMLFTGVWINIFLKIAKLASRPVFSFAK
jgi:hypothetical protein